MTRNKGILIGVTGGVGAGKSTVLGYLKEKYSARLLLLDEVGHSVINPGGSGYAAVLRLFGNEIAGDGGVPDRARIAEMIRNDPEKAAKLNKIVHPAVRQMTDKWIENFRSEASLNREKFPLLAVMESAILIEAGYTEICDEVWYIYADEAVRRKRLEKNRGWNRERIEATIKAQKSDTEFRTAADVVIDNSGTAEYTRAQTDKEVLRLYTKGTK